MTPDELQVERAKRLRAKEIDRLKEKTTDLELCTCLYPIVILRNRSGHRSDCLAHTRWMERKEKEELDAPAIRRGSRP